MAKKKPQPEPEAVQGETATVYRTTRYHEITVGDGVKRADVGMIVVQSESAVDVYTPEDFAEALPGVTDVPDQPED